MRSTRNYVGDFESSFLSCEKDTELIVKKLLVDSRPYSDELKRLLLINNKDCLDDRTNQHYKDIITSYSVADLIDEGYIRCKPQLKMAENQEVKNYIIISYDNFTPHPADVYYRDCIVEIDIISHIECWDLGNFRQRPIKIMGYIDAILNESRLTGLGRLEFLGAQASTLKENFAGYVLLYRIVRGNEDYLPDDETVESFITTANEMNE